MIRAIIIEDEDFAAERLQFLLGELDPSIEIVEIIKSIKQAVKWLSVNAVDLIFLDINLSDGIAFKIFEHLEIKTPIIFTTAYHEYALRAFEKFSIDYLLKPISRDRLKSSLDKYKALKGVAIRQENANFRQMLDLLRAENKPKRFMVNIGNKVKVIESSQIAYFSFDSKITFIHTQDDKRYPIDNSLKKIQLSLPEQDYFRVNRQFLLGRSCINEIQYYSPTRLKVHVTPTSGEEIIVARDKIGAFKKWWVS